MNAPFSEGLSDKAKDQIFFNSSFIKYIGGTDFSDNRKPTVKDYTPPPGLPHDIQKEANAVSHQSPPVTKTTHPLLSYNI